MSLGRLPLLRLCQGLAALSVVGLGVGLWWAPARRPEELGAPAAFSDVRAVMVSRCVSCHSASPSDDVFRIAPNGVKFDTPEQIKAMAVGIKLRVVTAHTMPLANKTLMTEPERALVGRWVDQGAPLPAPR